MKNFLLCEIKVFIITIKGEKYDEFIVMLFSIINIYIYLSYITSMRPYHHVSTMIRIDSLTGPPNHKVANFILPLAVTHPRIVIVLDLQI